MNASPTDVRMLPLDAVTLDPELQPRAKLDAQVIEDYREEMERGTEFPPVWVVRLAVGDKQAFLLVDGFHRWHATGRAGLGEIAAKVIDGSRRDALLLSLAANHDSALPRSAKDFKAHPPLRGSKMHHYILGLYT